MTRPTPTPDRLLCRFRKELGTATIFLLSALWSPAQAGTDPAADLTAPIPLCADIDAALALTPAAFNGLHPDAFAQFRGLLADLCAQPVAMGQGFCGIDRACGGGPYHPALGATPAPTPAPVPLPWPGLLLITALATLTLKGIRT